MKKYLSIVAILASCLVACGRTSTRTEEVTKVMPTEDITSETITTTTTTETTTKVTTTVTEIPPATTTTEPPIPELKQLLFDDSGIKVYYVDADANNITFFYQNDSDYESLHIVMRDFYVNGEEINWGYEYYMPKPETVECDCVIPLENLQAKNITRMNEIKFYFIVSSGDNLIKKTDTVTITR